MNNKVRARNTTLGAMIMTACSIGSNVTIPVFVLPLITKFGVGAGEITLIFTFAGIGGMITSFLLGVLMKKIPVKVLVASAGVCLMTFFSILGLSTSLTLIYATAPILGYATTVGAFGVAQTVIIWWNAENIAKKISLVSVTVGICGMIFPILAGILLNSFSFTIVSIGLGIVAGIIVVFCGVLMISDHPSKYGMIAYGAKEETAQQPGQLKEDAELAKSLSVKQIISTSYFWMIIASIFIMTLASTGFTNNAPKFYTSIGISETMAATLAGLTAGTSILCSILFGVLVDKMGPSRPIILYGIIIALTYVAATFVFGAVGGIVISVILGFKTMTGMIGSMTLPRLFGKHEAASVIGFSTVSSNLGSMFGAPFAGFIFDATGSYNTFFFIAAAMVIGAVLFINIGLSSKAQDRVKLIESQL